MIQYRQNNPCGSGAPANLLSVGLHSVPIPEYSRIREKQSGAQMIN